MKVYGAAARMFALKDDVKDWHLVTEYEVREPEDLPLAKWLKESEAEKQ